jgi:hypothetical protein
MGSRDLGETTLVMPYASIEAAPRVSGAPSASPPSVAPRTSRVLLEATLLWGRDTLSVRHMPARGEVRVRDLGLDGLDVSRDRGGDLLVGDVDAATGSFGLVLPNGTRVPEGCRMTVRMGRALVRLALVPDDVAKLPRSRRDPLVAFGILAAAVLHVIVLGTMAHTKTDEGETEASARATMLKMVASAEERALAEVAAARQKSREMAADDHAPSSALASTAAKEEAKAGNVAKTAGTVARARITHGEDRHAVAKVPPTTTARRDRKSDRDESASFGILQLLGGDASERGGLSAFAPESGRAAMGNIFGQTIDDAAGIGGLGLSGAGEGGGGKGAGVPLGGTTGYGCCGDVPAREVRMREHHVGYHWVGGGGSWTTVNGRLMPELVQWVVRQSFGRLRACYEAGLQRDPGLEGRVSVQFVIDREGAVTMASPISADTTLPDRDVLRCITKAYESMSFPKPEGGIVNVIYPIVFTSTSP